MHANALKDTSKALFALGASAMLFGLAACGGGGGAAGPAANPPAGSAPPAPQTGSISIVLRDGPTDEFCQILAQVQRIDLLGDGGSTTLWSGDVTVDVLALRNYSDLFAVAPEVPIGDYTKIRLTLADLALVRCDADGVPLPASDWEHPKLPGNGKLDLNPRGTITVIGGEALVIEIDMDMEKSLFVHQTGNGKWQFRPVVFVNVAPEGTRLVRVFGRVRDLGTGGFELCPLNPPSSMDHDSGPGDTGNMSDDDDSGRCLDVFTDSETGIFDTTGLPVGLAAVANGDELTAIGFLSRHDDDDDADNRADDLRLDAVVLELGPRNTFARLLGEVQTAPGNNDIFDFQPTGADPANVRLQGGTRIFSLRSNEPLTSAAIQPGVLGEVNGVFTVPDATPPGEPLRSSLIVLQEGAAPPERVLAGAVVSELVKTPSAADPTGEFAVQVAGAPACVKTDSATRFLLITETADSSVTEQLDFGMLAVDDVIDVFGSSDGAGCVLADTVQEYATTGG